MLQHFIQNLHLEELDTKIISTNFALCLFFCLLIYSGYLYDRCIEYCKKKNPLYKAIREHTDLTPHLIDENISYVDRTGNTLMNIALNEDISAEMIGLLFRTMYRKKRDLLVNDKNQNDYNYRHKLLSKLSLDKIYKYGNIIIFYDVSIWNHDIVNEFKYFFDTKTPDSVYETISEKNITFDMVSALEYMDTNHVVNKRNLEFVYKCGRYTSNNETILHTICKKINSIFILKFFIKKGYDINGTDSLFHTPIYYAIKYRDGLIVTLLEKGADISFVGNVANYRCFIDALDKFNTRKELSRLAQENKSIIQKIRVIEQNFDRLKSLVSEPGQLIFYE